MSLVEVVDILDWVYDGEVLFNSETRYNRFLNAARKLGLKGFSEAQAPAPSAALAPAAAQALPLAQAQAAQVTSSGYDFES